MCLKALALPLFQFTLCPLQALALRPHQYCFLICNSMYCFSRWKYSKNKNLLSSFLSLSTSLCHPLPLYPPPHTLVTLWVPTEPNEVELG